MDLNVDWVEVFRAGDYGSKGNFTVADLDRMAEDYDPSMHEAPVVIGHPAEDAPAWGWVEKLRRAGNSLWAKLRQVQPEFEDMVRRGLFKQRSIALYSQFEKTGRPYLRHLGFLGAAPPHVKGLKPLFGFSGYAQVIEFSDTPPEQTPTRLVRATVVSAGYIPVDPESLELAREADLLAAANNLSYGEALRLARRQKFGE